MFCFHYDISKSLLFPVVNCWTWEMAQFVEPLVVHVLDMVLTFIDLINQGIRESSVPDTSS